MSLSLQIDALWEENRSAIEVRLGSWLAAMKKGDEVLSEAKSFFHDWHPLRTYVTISKQRGNTAIFSLRYAGQEIAELRATKRMVTVSTTGNRSANDTFFKWNPAAKFEWRSPAGQEMRKYFSKHFASTNGKPRVESKEHRVESKFIDEMYQSTTKFGCRGLQIKPVMAADCFPMQIPVPLSANTGKPCYKTKGNGYIDILARRRQGKVRLSVWELKQPGAYKFAASQAFIYAYSLLKILRESEHAEGWFKAYGFSGKIPRNIEIEAVVAITSDQMKRFAVESRKIKDENSLVFGDDRIILHHVNYEEDRTGIRLVNHSFGALEN